MFFETSVQFEKPEHSRKNYETVPKLGTTSVFTKFNEKRSMDLSPLRKQILAPLDLSLCRTKNHSLLFSS